MYRVFLMLCTTYLVIVTGVAFGIEKRVFFLFWGMFLVAVFLEGAAENASPSFFGPYTVSFLLVVHLVHRHRNAAMPWARGSNCVGENFTPSWRSYPEMFKGPVCCFFLLWTVLNALTKYLVVA